MKTLTGNEFLSLIEDTKEKLLRHQDLSGWKYPHESQEDYFTNLRVLLNFMINMGHEVSIELKQFENGSHYYVFYFSETLRQWIGRCPNDLSPEINWEGTKNQLLGWYEAACEQEIRLSKCRLQ